MGRKGGGRGVAGPAGGLCIGGERGQTQQQPRHQVAGLNLNMIDSRGLVDRRVIVADSMGRFVGLNTARGVACRR